MSSMAGSPSSAGGGWPGHSPGAAPSPQFGSYASTSYLPPGQAGGPRYSAPPFPPPPRPSMYATRLLPAPVPAPRPAMAGLRPLPPPAPPKPPVPGTMEKPFTTVYVGKIAATVDDIFLRRILEICGRVKSWKRAQDPTTNAARGFGFCEFENAEGVLRALRLLNKHNLDGQELVLNVNKDTREYLERYVASKENFKLLMEEDDNETAPGVEIQPRKLANDSSSETFGLVTEEDKKADKEAVEALKSALDERARSRPYLRPVAVDGRSVKLRDAELREKNVDDDDSDKGRRANMERERSERERERERFRRGNRNTKMLDTERVYDEREREWEAREREKERIRLQEREREKERERERKREVKQEEDSDDEDWKKKRYRGTSQEERRRRRHREREEDIADVIKEQQEIAEAKKRRIEDAQRIVERAVQMPLDEIPPEEKVPVVAARKPYAESPEKPAHAPPRYSPDRPPPEETQVKLETENRDSCPRSELDGSDGTPTSNGACETTQDMDVDKDSPKDEKPFPKKLNFGLSGAGKRNAVPLFKQEDEEEAPKDRKLRPLVPIDYSAEEMQAVASSKSKASGTEESKKDKRHKERSRRERAKEEPKIMDAKQLIDTIPKTKDELFSYPVDWVTFDKHKLHEKMRPWISKKITEFLGEEENTFIDYIVNQTRKHVSAASMLELLESILDNEAEMFVLKLWRMLIFEIRRIETGV